jgi:ABC-2 type transport system permease protein
MSTRKTLLVAAREVRENVRTKGFWLGILFLPLLLCITLVAPLWLRKMKEARAFVVVDRSGWLATAVDARAATEDIGRALATAIEWRRSGGARVERLPEPLSTVAERLERLPGDGAALSESVGSLREWWSGVGPEQARELGTALGRARFIRVASEADAESLEALNRRVASGELFAYFVVPADPLADGAQLRYVSTNITDEELRNWFSRLAGDEVRERRLATERIAPEVAARVQRPVSVSLTRLDDEGREAPVEEEDMLRAWAPAGFTYVLWMAVFALSQGLLISTIEEKSSRVIEVLLSSVSSRQLMAGKIAGVMATGLITVAVWAGCFFLIAFFLPDIADRWLGLGRVDLDLTSVAAEPTFIVSFLFYFLLAYLFYATLLVGIGSLCNTVQEAQNLMAPVMVTMIVPLLIVMSMPEDPNSTLARVLSYVPPFTPFVMMGRAAAAPPIVEYLMTTLLLLTAIALIFVAAAKVFETGILVTDKRPPMREVMRWIREPGGTVRGVAADG